jgi:cobalt-zinc-cadmium efflux system outer membrane protein
MKKAIHFGCIAAVLVLTRLAQAEVADSVLTLQQAKARLLKNNFYLMATYYEVNQAEARLIQAKVWNNPTFNFYQEAYNKQEKNFFQTSNQFEVQISQAFSIAGKHTNTVKLAKVNIELNRYLFQDVLRSLLYDLQITYNELAAREEKEKLYKQVLASFDRLILSTEKELQVGEISVIENIRIKSEHIALKAQALENSNQLTYYLSHLRTLLQIPVDSSITVEQRIPLFNAAIRLDTLTTRAFKSRPDLKVYRMSQQYQYQNLQLQRSLSVPDITLGYDYDKGANYTPNYSGLTLALPLPIFDRNQGRIKEAKYGIKQAELQYEYLKISIANQVSQAYQKYIKNSEGLSNYDPKFLNKLDELNKSVNVNFKKRNISLLEFIDQQRNFITTKIQEIELKQNFLDSVNELNFLVGEPIIEE